MIVRNLFTLSAMIGAYRIVICIFDLVVVYITFTLQTTMSLVSQGLFGLFQFTYLNLFTGIIDLFDFM
jgi:hypothetical protein